MGEDKPVVDKLPLAMQPWAHLINFTIEKVHVIGLPWVIILLTLLFGVPFAKDIAKSAASVAESQRTSNDRMKSLEEKADKAIPILHAINQATVDASESATVDRKQVAETLKATIEEVKDKK